MSTVINYSVQKKESITICHPHSHSYLDSRSSPDRSKLIPWYLITIRSPRSKDGRPSDKPGTFNDRNSPTGRRII